MSALADPAAVAASSTLAVHAPGTPAPRPPRAVRIRRWALVSMPVLAGILAVVGAAADPAAGISGTRMLDIYAQHPDPLQIKSLAFHWAYAFWIGMPLLLAGYVRGRGAWLANIAAVIGFAGMTTLPGLLFIDWVDSATGQLWGTAGVEAMHDRVADISWGMPFFQLPGFLGLALALPLAALALWRARLVRWWAPVAVVLGLVAFLGSSVTWPGCLVTLACFSAFAWAVERATRRGIHDGPPA